MNEGRKGPPLEIGPRAAQSNTDSVGGKPALMVRIDKEPLVICWQTKRSRWNLLPESAATKDDISSSEKSEANKASRMCVGSDQRYHRTAYFDSIKQ